MEGFMARSAAAAVGAALAASITAAPAQTIVDGSGQSVPPDHLAILLSIARDNSPNMELAQVRVAHVLGGYLLCDGPMGTDRRTLAAGPFHDVLDEDEYGLLVLI